MTTDLGTDISCLTDIDTGFSLTSGTDNLLRALARRLSTPAGALALFGGDPDYGLDLRGALNREINVSELGLLEGQIADECRRDERVQDCRARIAYSFAEHRMEVTIEGLSDVGPFSRVLSVDQVSVALLSAQDEPAAAAPATASTRVIVLAGTQGPPGPAGATGATGGGGGAAEAIEFDDANQYSTASGTEELLVQVAQDASVFEVGATLNTLLVAAVKSSSGTATFRLRIGGTEGLADGTVVATITTSSASFVSARGTGTHANPGGLVLLKVTAQSSGGGNTATIRGIEAGASLAS